jgi:hypothetical protein
MNRLTEERVIVSASSNGEVAEHRFGEKPRVVLDISAGLRRITEARLREECPDSEGAHP